MQQQEEKLRQEILSDAERKAKRTIRRAEQDAKKLLSSCRKDMEAKRKQRLAEAEKEGRERAIAVKAGILTEIHRCRLKLTEELISSVFDEALDRIKNLDAASKTSSYQRLLHEAAAAFPSQPLNVWVNPDNARHLPEEKVSETVAEVFTADTPPKAVVKLDEAVADGVLVTSEDGRRQFDNTYTAKLSRMREQLRAEVFEALTESAQDSEGTTNAS